MVLLAIVGFTVLQSHKGVVAVQTGKVVREDLTSVVTASGEIKPKVYVNIGANAFAKITHLYVKEGDQVKEGQLLAVLDNIQSSADVAAMDSALVASRADAAAAQAAVNTSAADLNQAKAEHERARLDFERNKALYEQQLIAKSDYDTKKAAWDTAQAQLGQAEAKLAQSKANLNSFQVRISQNAANLRRASDVLSKTEYRAPFNGVITNLPVREGETVVVGIQNAPGSTLMTIADTSIITAEVKVDESDIVNVQIGQPAEISVDAIPKQKFKGVVSEIGRNAVLRSTGVSTAQTVTSGQEAKDFKVVVALQNPPPNLLPGLSAVESAADRSGRELRCFHFKGEHLARDRGESVRLEFSDSKLEYHEPAVNCDDYERAEPAEHHRRHRDRSECRRFCRSIDQSSAAAAATAVAGGGFVRATRQSPSLDPPCSALSA